jgi:nitroreductase
MDLHEMLLARRSVRKYKKEHISGEDLQQILEAGVSSPTSRGTREWEFILVQTRDTLDKLADCRKHGSSFLRQADCAVVVFGDETETDVWIEDCSIAMAYMHLMADQLGLGSCWIQGRNRDAIDGETTEEFLRPILRFPDNYRLEAILALGMPEEETPVRSPESLPFEKVHINQF